MPRMGWTGDAFYVDLFFIHTLHVVLKKILVHAAVAVAHLTAIGRCLDVSLLFFEL